MIPTRLLETDVFETASDLWFVDVEGDDGSPEMAIGRLPVATPDECRQVVERILRYETGSLQAPGIRRVLLVADEAEEFSVMNAGIAGSIPPSVATTFLDAGAPLPPGTDLQTLLIESWLRTDVVQYSGHGARTTWSALEILHIDDVPLLESSRLPVVVAMNCLNGFFHHVATPALGEALLLDPDGGAIAYWGPTGVTSHLGQEELARELYLALFAPGTETLGQAIRSAQAVVAEDPARRTHAATWVLLGDPALRVW